MNLSTFPQVTALIQQRQLLKSRQASLVNAQTLNDLLSLLTGTGLEAAVVQEAQTLMGPFFTNQIASIEGQLTTLGVNIGG